ncbi:MAG: methionyl-tRNA formyltransferase [Candidatus Moranbacteria bacterium]|nr:methionyl-tRNA formyltransferase [Candidatus Moranbacteria bacterium]NTW45530.1 methionyl-tRNA formyltransferase [Candidatus Moranbacteria bacterium]
MSSEHATGTENRSEAPKIRVIFMGTPEFARDILSGLVTAGFNVVAVYTRPDRPVGRNRAISEPPVKTFAKEQGIAVEQPERFDEETIRKLTEYHPDLIIVAAYGRILPETVLAIPGFGCLNVHASLLPRWRGASPVQNALLSGDTETGVTIMLMDKGLDTGPILAQRTMPVSDSDTRETLLSRMAIDGVMLLSETVPRWIERRCEPAPQDSEKATLCELIEREDGHIFWNEDATTILNRFRGLSPWPGIFTFWKRQDGRVRLKLTAISIQRTDPAVKHSFGEVFEIGEHIAVQAGTGLVFIDGIQPEGKAPMSIRDFVNGRPDFIGSILE